jgi:SET domain-containing protein
MNIEIDNAPLAYIKESKIQGKGLFAEVPFLEGEVILNYVPWFRTFYKIKWEDLTKYQISYNWYIPVDEEWCLTSDIHSKFHYFNHSRNPNCKWLIQQGIIKAARYIPVNEELTIDYRVEYRPNRVSFAD